MSEEKDNQKILETDKELKSLVSELRKILKEKHKIDIPPQCDKFLARCLRQKDGNLEKAVKLVQVYQKGIPEFESWNSVLQPSYYDTPFYSIPIIYPILARDKLGRRVAIGEAKYWNPDKMTLEECVAATWMMTQYAMATNIQDQKEGFVILWDFQDFSLKQVWALKQRTMLKVAKWMHSGLTGKVKGFHVINHPRMVGLVYKWIKPFVSEKIIKRVFLHNSLKELHENIALDPKYLPKCMGGTMEVAECMDKQFMKQLVNSDEFFQDMVNYRFPVT